MRKYFKMVFLGFLSWLIPFVFSFLFYSGEGELSVDVFLFKSIMIVVGSATGAALLVFYFRDVRADHFREGVVVGLVVFALNVLLDFIVLLPMSGMGVETYFAQIGLRYLIIPIMSAAIGYVAGRQTLT